MIGRHWTLTFEPHAQATMWFDHADSSTHNILDTAALDDLDTVLETLESAIAGGRKVDLAIVRSRKQRGFCAGADLKAFRGRPHPESIAALGRLGIRVFDRLASLPVPTVAVVSGVCVGGALELALACDSILSIEGLDAKFGMPEVNLGLVPGWGGVAAIFRAVEANDALAMVLCRTPDPIDATEAARIGLVNGSFDSTSGEVRIAGARPKVTWPPADPERLIERVDRVISELPNTTDDAIQGARLAIRELIEIDLTRGDAAAKEASAEMLAQRAALPEVARRIDEFFAKRSAARTPGDNR